MFLWYFCRKGRKWKRGENLQKKLKNRFGRSDLAKSLVESWSKFLEATHRDDLGKRFAQINCPNRTDAGKTQQRGKRKNFRILKIQESYPTSNITRPILWHFKEPLQRKTFSKEVLFMIKYKGKEGIKDYKRPSQIRIPNPNWTRTLHL